MSTYDQFYSAHATLSREEFLRQVEEPHLLMEMSNPGGVKSAGFMTVKFSADAIRSVKDPGLPPAQAQGGANLYPIKKREGSNAFGMMITMGRASNNDLVIQDQKVSKFHAYFRLVGEEWRVHDANSRNGTFLNGLPVPQEQGMKVVSGMRIKLAKSLELVFYDPSGLYQRIQDDRQKEEA